MGLADDNTRDDQLLDSVGRITVCKHGGLRRKCEVCELEAESAGRLKALNEKANQLVVEWTRAENAEARVQELESEVARLAADNQTMMDIMCNECDNALAALKEKP